MKDARLALLFAFGLSVFGSILAHARIEKAPAFHPQGKAPQASPVKTESFVSSSRKSEAKPYPFVQKNIGPKSSLLPTEIAGCCVLLKSRVRAETLSGRTDFDSEITTLESFTITGLRNGETYNISISHPSYKDAVLLERVRAGNWIDFHPIPLKNVPHPKGHR